ncbi:uncharacterized protein LOC141605590 [Silene latifolia]|uniref:uncharacterized protein LOC141605590 n=1 Tax=Silene latifolia TaxID=37657 RepID=UPI003D7774D9
MSTNDTPLVPTQSTDATMSSHLLFQDHNPVRFSCSPSVRRGSSEPGPKQLFTMDNRERYFSPGDQRSNDVFSAAMERRGINGSGDGRRWGDRGPRSESSDDDGDDLDGCDDDDDDDDDEDDEGGDATEGLVRIGGINSHNSVVVSRIGVDTSKDHASFGTSVRQIMMDGVLVQPGDDVNRASTSGNGQKGRFGPFNQMVTVAEHVSDMYHTSSLPGTEGSSQGQKDAHRDNGCGFSGRKDGFSFCDPAESLRAIFSDPITGALMDDAMLLPCGHSFGGGGIQQVIKMKACYTCLRPVNEDSVGPNLSLRTAVQAFRREADLLGYRASKRRRERFEQDKSNNHGDPRGRGVQFPFVVTDRVIIKGNKRTPPRFVGREAIVTTQCLNGWYVVKTLDNAESVKLQYRSLAKVSDSSALGSTPEKMTPNWL